MLSRILVRSTVLFVAAMLAGCVADKNAGIPGVPGQPVGSVFTDKIRIGRSVAPLPPGEWILAGTTGDRSQMVDGSMRTQLTSAILVKAGSGTASRPVDGMVYLAANNDAQPVEWLQDQFCIANTDRRLFVEHVFKANTDQFCLAVYPYTTNWNYNRATDSVDLRAADWMKSQNFGMAPEQFLAARYRIVRDSDFMVAIYYTPNRLIGAPNARDANWQPGVRSAELEKALAGHIASSKDWTNQVRATFEGKLPAQLVTK
jgi:hypothetical protein